jgi:hypothetical protein
MVPSSDPEAYSLPSGPNLQQHSTTFQHHSLPIKMARWQGMWQASIMLHIHCGRINVDLRHPPGHNNHQQRQLPHLTVCTGPWCPLLTSSSAPVSASCRCTHMSPPPATKRFCTTQNTAQHSRAHHVMSEA